MRDCKGNILFAAGFPIGARAALLAHDFASQSLVCYYIIIPLLPADAGKGLAAYSAVRQSVAANAFSRQ